MKDFWQRVNEKAYLNYLNRINNGILGDEKHDWEDAERDAIIEDRVREEAFLHYLKHGDDPLKKLG